jgi:lysozyme
LFYHKEKHGTRDNSSLSTNTYLIGSVCKHGDQYRLQDEEVNMNQLIEQLKRHEGMELKPYKCTSDKLTIGIGRNLEDVGISEKEAELLLTNDIESAGRLLKDKFPWTMELDEVRFAALINFTFNVGIGTVSKFVNAMALLKEGNYDMASEEFLQSRWANQVGQRAIDVTEQIRTGEWQ